MNITEGTEVALAKHVKLDDYWQGRDVDHDSIGTAIRVLIARDLIIEVEWCNGRLSLTDSSYLKVYENNENVPLPNLKFKRRRIEQ